EARLREPRLELHDLLEILDRRGRLALGEMHSPSDEKSLEVRGALLEKSVEHLEALVVLPLGQSEIGETALGREELRSVLGDLRQDSLALLGLLEPEVELHQLEPGRRPNGRKLGRHPVFALGLRGIALPGVEVPQRRMRFLGLRLLGY